MDLDINRLEEILRPLNWTFAKTMPHIPHEYVIRGKTMEYEPFEFTKECIREFGVYEEFGGRMWQYLYVGDHKYWTDGWTADHNILNRAKIMLSVVEEREG